MKPIEFKMPFLLPSIMLGDPCEFLWFFSYLKDEMAFDFQIKKARIHITVC